MKRFSEQLYKKSQTVKMTATERRDLKARLVSYMEYHPMPKSSAVRNAERYIASEKFISFNFNTVFVRSFAGLFAVFVLVFVPVIAEKSVPGDVLYPVKVNFNEEIRSSLSVSPYAKVEWETERLERRIAEARLLASEGKLTPEAEEEVMRAVKEHSDAAEASIEAIRENDNDDAVIAEIAFESALSVQSEVLESTLKKEVAAGTIDNTKGSSIVAIASAVAEKQKEAELKHSGATPSYEKLMAKIERESTRAYELFETVRESATRDEISDIERRLADIERSVSEAMELYGSADSTTNTEEVSPAIALLRAELSDITKLVSFMTDIDVRANVTVDELVPVALTDEEKAAALVIQHQTIDERLAALVRVIDMQEISDFSEKIGIGLAFAQKQASSSKAALEAGRYAKSKIAANEALAAISDLEKLVTVKVDTSTTSDAISDEEVEVTPTTGATENGEPSTSEMEV